MVIVCILTHGADNAKPPSDTGSMFGFPRSPSLARSEPSLAPSVRSSSDAGSAADEEPDHFILSVMYRGAPTHHELRKQGAYFHVNGRTDGAARCRS